MILGDLLNFCTPNPQTAFVMSVGAGAVVTYLWSDFVHWLLKRRFPGAKGTRIMWIPVVTGIIERAAVTAFVIWIPAAVGPFSATWIVVKAAGGWSFMFDLSAGTDDARQKKDDFKTALYSVGLLGSIVSLGWAIAWGLWAPASHHYSN